MHILLVEDHPMFREALREHMTDLFSEATFTEIAHVSDFPETWDSLSFDLVIMDLELFQEFQFDRIRNLRAHFAELPIIVVSMHCDASRIQESIRAGASAFVTKHDAADCFESAINTVLQGGKFLSERASAIVVTNMGEEQRLQDMIKPLSAREKEIFALLRKGSQREQLDSLLHISPSTVNTHLDNMRKKLDLPSVDALIEVAQSFREPS